MFGRFLGRNWRPTCLLELTFPIGHYLNNDRNRPKEFIQITLQSRAPPKHPQAPPGNDYGPFWLWNIFWGRFLQLLEFPFQTMYIWNTMHNFQRNTLRSGSSHHFYVHLCTYTHVFLDASCCRTDSVVYFCFLVIGNLDVFVLHPVLLKLHSAWNVWTPVRLFFMGIWMCRISSFTCEALCARTCVA